MVAAAAGEIRDMMTGDTMTVMTIGMVEVGETATMMDGGVIKTPDAQIHGMTIDPIPDSTVLDRLLPKAMDKDRRHNRMAGHQYRDLRPLQHHQETKMIGTLYGGSSAR
jgi:hypothetical protein